jgi:hypothetical protein
MNNAGRLARAAAVLITAAILRRLRATALINSTTAVKHLIGHLLIPPGSQLG